MLSKEISASETLARNVLRIRKEMCPANKKQFTQEQFAEICRISVRYVRKIESGLANPTLQILEKIAAGAGVSISALLSLQDD